MTTHSQSIAPPAPSETVKLRYGSLEISSDQGGTVYVDGQRHQELEPFAVLALSNLQAGRHTVRVEKPTYRTEQQEVTVRPDQVAKAEFRLTPLVPTANSEATGGQPAARAKQPLWNAAPTTEREIEIAARKYEFDPNVITVKNGERVKLVVTALDHDHGFKLAAFKINEVLKKGEPTTVEFTADQVGTFPFECSHFCGVGHGKMKGKLVVTER